MKPPVSAERVQLEGTCSLSIVLYDAFNPPASLLNDSRAPTRNESAASENKSDVVKDEVPEKPFILFNNTVPPKGNKLIN